MYFEYYSVQDSKATIKDLGGPTSQYNFGYDIFTNLIYGNLLLW